MHCFESDGAKALLHVEVPYRELGFRKVGDRLVTRFDLIVHVFQQERQVAGDVWTERLELGGRDELHGRGARFIKDLIFPLNPGRYVLEVRLSEPDSGLEGAVCLGTTIPLRIPGQSLLSALLVGECGLRGRIAELRRLPGIRSEITEAADSICVYAELDHPGTDVDEVTIRWWLRGSGEEIVDSGEARFDGGGEGFTPLRWSIPIHDLWLDVYRVDAEARAGDQVSRSSAHFGLLIELDPALAGFFRESLGVLEYIAEEEELQHLRMAAGDERQRLWAEFWKRRDPTPETEENEFKTEFFRRVRYANEAFTVIRPGWRTDRGRIYIIYGPPGEISHDVYAANSRGVEIWDYYNPRVRFVFIDRNGYGDYTLMPAGW